MCLTGFLSDQHYEGSASLTSNHCLQCIQATAQRTHINFLRCIKYTTRDRSAGQICYFERCLTGLNIKMNFENLGGFYLTIFFPFISSASFTASYALIKPPVMLSSLKGTVSLLPGFWTFKLSNLRVDFSRISFISDAENSG